MGDSATIKWYFQPDANPEKWPSNTSRRSFFGSPAIGPDGTIYIGGFNGYVYAIEDLGNDYIKNLIPAFDPYNHRLNRKNNRFL